MKHADVSLGDRYDLSKKDVLLNGTQALVRLMLTQRWVTSKQVTIRPDMSQAIVGRRSVGSMALSCKLASR